MIKKEFILDILSKSEEEKLYKSGKNDIERSIYMADNKNIINSKKLLKSGKLITVRPHPRFIHFPCHTHDYVELVYMVSGSTEHIINGKRVILKEGDLLFLNQNASQEILPAKENDIAVNFIILPQFFDVTLGMLGDENTPLRDFLIACLVGNKKSSYLHFKVRDVLPVQNLLENLIYILSGDLSNRRKINETSMGLLFLHLLNHTDKLELKSSEDSLVFKVLSYIENNYVCGSLTELSEIMFYDFNALSREIKKKTGKTFTELMQEKRLSQAVFLLKNTDIGIDSVATSVGYENISYFHRLFKQKYGVTPKQYRKNYNCK